MVVSKLSSRFSTWHFFLKNHQKNLSSFSFSFFPFFFFSFFLSSFFSLFLFSPFLFFFLFLSFSGFLDFSFFLFIFFYFLFFLEGRVRALYWVRILAHSWPSSARIQRGPPTVRTWSTDSLAPEHPCPNPRAPVRTPLSTTFILQNKNDT